MKMGLDKKTIIEAAVGMADENGFESVSLKALASKLGVRSPSLYKHFGGGLDELNDELMLYGWHLLEQKITKAAVGKAGDDAISAVCRTYRDFVRCHKGLFEAMQWYNMYRSQEHLLATQGTVEILFRVLDAYGLNEVRKVHCVRMLRGFLQGFCSIECHGGFGDPVALDETFAFAIKTVLRGIRDSAREVTQ